MLPFQGLAWTLALTTTVRPSFTAASSLLDFLGSLTPLCPRGPSARTRHGGAAPREPLCRVGSWAQPYSRRCSFPGERPRGDHGLQRLASDLRPPCSDLSPAQTAGLQSAPFGAGGLKPESVIWE